MVVFSYISLDYNPFTGSDTCNIAAAFGPGGENDCRSLGSWLPAYPPYYDGYWYFNIVSNSNNEPISFKIYDSLSDSTYTCIQTINFEDGSTIGNPYTPFELTTHPVSIDSQSIQPINIIAYPNPFHDEITFSFSRSLTTPVSAVFYDISGSYVLKSESYSAKNNTLTISINDSRNIEIKPGIYLYSLSFDETVYIGKVLYIKD